MTKPLTQINFEFTDGEENELKTSTEANKERIVTDINPDIIEINENPVPGPITGRRGRRSLKDIGQSACMIRVPEDDILFQKQYYSIGEVAVMFGENQSLIRYWETEFDILQPRKNRKGDRFFRPADIKNLLLIYDLLRRRKFTIEGAKDYLKKSRNAEDNYALIQSLEKIKTFFLELKANL